jgi:hypothetical protein
MGCQASPGIIQPQSSCENRLQKLPQCSALPPTAIVRETIPRRAVPEASPGHGFSA